MSTRLLHVVATVSMIFVLAGCSRGDEPRHMPIETDQVTNLPEPQGPPVAAQTLEAKPVPTVKEPWTPGDFQKGVQLYWHSIGSDAAIKKRAIELLDYIVTLRANAVGISFSIYTDGAAPSTVYAGPETPTPRQLAIVVREAKARGFRVMIRPTINEVNIAESREGAWRGSIAPRNLSGWFAGYRKVLQRYVPVALKYDAEEFVAGAELNSMERYTSEWVRVKNVLRSNGFDGVISYAFNWDSMPTVPFDNLAVDAYPAIELPDSASIEALTGSILAWYNQKPSDFLRTLVTQEVGIPARSNMYPNPWYWGTGEGELNFAVQANWFTAMCRATKSAGLQGIYYWAIDSSTDLRYANPMTDYSGSFVGRPGAMAIKRCFSS